MRAGGFATAVSSREKAGASFYGVMEMSGNLWERCITTGIEATARHFQGMVAAGHGNGETGNGTTPELPIGGGWPAATGAGLGFRGGSYLDPAERARISDRYFINLNNTSQHQSFGGRGVRTAL
jgi:formylglycine-generating enzyme required for sulfatase activity